MDWFLVNNSLIATVMKPTLLLLLILIPSIPAQGQSDTIFSNKNSLSLELFGHGAYYSFNYERIVINKSKFKIGAQFGFAAYPFIIDNVPFATIISLNQLTSFKKFHLEIGIGQVYTSKEVEMENSFIKKETPDKLYTSLKAGIRFQNAYNRISYKLAFTPLIDVEQSKFIPWGGIGVGLSF